MWGKKKKKSGLSMRTEEINPLIGRIRKIMYKLVVLHENMTSKQIQNIEKLLNGDGEERHYINRLPIKISNTESLLVMEYSIPYDPKETEEL